MLAPDRSLSPYGHQVAAEQAPLRAVPNAKPSESGGKPSGGGSSDIVGPFVEALDPEAPAIVTSTAYTFSAQITDPDPSSGVKSATFVISKGPQTWSFSASSSGDTWTVPITGLSDGADWGWHVVATDNASKGGNTTTSEPVGFTVEIAPVGGGTDPGGGGVVTNAEWTGGAVQTASGRIYFEMPANRRQTRWSGYVCSGTVVTDATGGRSVILTAAHCVYDDVNKVFARNVLFIPNQAGTTGAGTDRNCTNDPLGCWEPSFGVVDNNWTTRKFPDNIPWDYAYYVVNDANRALDGQVTYLNGSATYSDSSGAGSLDVQFDPPTTGDVTHALGYSYSDDPNFMYCAEAMGTEGAANWWLPSCDLSGGSSGGPWIQPMDEATGVGPVISVNSWGYTTSPGMAGPKLSGTSAECVFGAATTTDFPVPARGVAATCPLPT